MALAFVQCFFSCPLQGLMTEISALTGTSQQAVRSPSVTPKAAGDGMCVGYRIRSGLGLMASQAVWTLSKSLNLLEPLSFQKMVIVISTHSCCED